MSHKAKAQKVDLATFYREQPEDDLPSAPDPNREPYDRNRRGGRGGGRDGGGDRGDRNYGDRGDRERGYGDRGDRGGRGGRGFGDRNDAPPANEEDDAGPWQRAGPSGRATRDTRDTGRNDRGYGDRNNNNRYGDRDRDSGRNDRGFGGGYRSDPPSAPPAGERPKLILEPRTLPVSEKSNVESITNKVENLTTGDAPSASSSSSASVDKFDRAFTKSRGNGEGSSGDFRKSGDRGSNYNDRGDRRGAFGGGRGFNNDRGGDSRGFGGDRGDRRGGYNDRGGDDRGDRGDSRNFNDRRGGYNDRGGNNERRSNRYETDSEPIDDPRFAGKFGSSSSRPGTDYDSRGTGTPNATSTTPTDISSIPTFAAPEKRDDAKANERKAAQEEKLQKAAAKAEAERKAKEEQQARKESELAAIERQKSDAANLVASGTKGAALVEIINNSEIKPAGAALVASILSSLPTVENITWTNPEEYGLALSTLLVGNDREQMLFIYELQKHCHKHNFPRIQTKSGQRSLIDILFQLLYKNDILESSGILKWWDDEEFDEIPGRSDALVQVTTFVNWLNEEEEADEEEEEDYEGLEPAPRNAA